MNVLKLTTIPNIEFTPRLPISTRLLDVEFTNEATGVVQKISGLADQLQNENYNLVLNSFVIAKSGDKFSFKILNVNEVVCLGKIMVINKLDSVQDFSNASTNKFYK